MGYASLATAVLALAGLLVPGHGKYVALGLGLFAAALGVVGYRRALARPAPRLAGAAGIAAGLAALVLGGAQVGLTLAAIDRLVSLFR